MDPVRDIHYPTKPFIDLYTTDPKVRIQKEVKVFKPGDTVIEIGNVPLREVLNLLDEYPNLNNLIATEVMGVNVFCEYLMRLTFNGRCKPEEVEALYHYLRDNLFPHWKAQNDALLLKFSKKAAA